MATDCRASELPWPRWLSLALLFVAEMVLLSIRFDTGSLGSAAGMPAMLVGSAPQFARLAFVVAVATLFVSGPTILMSIDRQIASVQNDAAERFGWLLLAHFAALLVFVWITMGLLEHSRFTDDRAALWVFGWMVSGAAAVGALALSALPARVWLQIATSAWRGLGVGVAAGLLVWGAGLFTYRLWTPLAGATLKCVRELLSLVYADVVCRPGEFIVGTSSFEVQIAPQCSGYEGMGLIAVVLVGYLCLHRRKLHFPPALALIPLGMAAMWLANVFRITALVAIGSSWSKSLALGGFHSQAGWLMFIGVAAGIVWAAGRTSWTTTVTAPRAAEPMAAAAYLAPLLAMIAVGMVGSAICESASLVYPLRITSGALALWHYRRLIPRFLGKPSPASLAAGAAVFGLWLFLAHDKQIAMNTDWRPTSSNALAVILWMSRIVGFCMITPLAEELAFRGFLMRRLISTDFERHPLYEVTWTSWLISSLAFGALHGENWLAGTLAGMVYALAANRRGRLGDAVIAHCTTNGLLATYSFTTGNFGFWS